MDINKMDINIVLGLAFVTGVGLILLYLSIKDKINDMVIDKAVEVLIVREEKRTSENNDEFFRRYNEIEALKNRISNLEHDRLYIVKIDDWAIRSLNEDGSPASEGFLSDPALQLSFKRASNLAREFNGKVYHAHIDTDTPVKLDTINYK